MHLPKSYLDTNCKKQIELNYNYPSFCTYIMNCNYNKDFNTYVYTIYLGISHNEDVIYNYINKRYSDILFFYNNIKNILDYNDIIVNFPCKKWFKNTVETINDRKNKLNIFFNILSKVPNIINNIYFKKFYNL